MNRKDAEKLADEIFDMIDQNHPRGLIKSELADLLAKFDLGSTSVLPGNDFMGQTGPCEWITLEEALSEVELIQVPKCPGRKTKSDLAADKKALIGLGYYFQDLCGND